VITSEETSGVREAVADARGRYRALDLPPGRYSVTIQLQGFSPRRVDGVLLTMGSTAIVDAALEIAPLRTAIVVRGVDVVREGTASAAGGLVTRTQIEQLPLNGRSFLQLGALQPGVVVSRASGREFSGGFGTTQLSLGGGRPEQTGYLLDGTNIADISDKAPSSLAGVLLGVDAIREFSVQTHGYGAEFGRAAGGIVSAVTRSGTNQIRGSLFEFHRDSALDADNFFAPDEVPDFRRDQFGGSLGGPIRRGRVFFFASYEGLRARNIMTRSARLPDADAHAGRLPDDGGGWRQVSVHPTVRPYLDLLFPVPDGRSFGDGTAERRHAHRDPVDEDNGLARIDWQASRNDQLMIRVSADRSAARTSLDHPMFFNETGTSAQYVTAQHQRLVGASAINSLRVARNRTARDDDVLSTVEIPPELYFTEDPHFGAINVIGVTLVGSTATIPARYDQRVWQIADTLTVVRGDHTWKLGVDWQRYAFDGYSYSRYGGEFRFRNLEEFLTLERSETAQADRFTGNLPGTDTRRAMRQHYVAAFVQDDWRPRSDLTVNLGLRYELVTSPVEREGRVAGLLSLGDLETGPGGVTPGTPLFDAPAGAFAPRVGVSWQPGAGRLRVHGGYGIVHQPLTVSYYRGTTFRVYPYFAGVDLRRPEVFGPGIQDVLAGGAEPRRRSEFIVYDARQPFVQQWHVRAERELGRGVTAELGYLGSRGHNLPFYGDPNAVPSEVGPDGRKRVVPGASIRYPSWGRIRTRTNVARSRSDALLASIRRQLSDGLVLQASYTLSDSKDTWSGGQMGTSDFENGAGSATDWWDPEAEYGPSNFDVRHTLVVNGVYALPGGGGSGFSARLLEGWTVGGVLQLASGLPFTPFIGFDRAGDQQSDADVIQKPDQVAQIRYLRTPEAWFDVTAFALPPQGTYGNAGRNSLRGPGLKTLDLVVAKRLRFDRVTAELRLEAYNALNWVNLGLPDASVLFNTDGTYRAGAGRISSTATPARQVQVGVRISY